MVAWHCVLGVALRPSEVDQRKWERRGSRKGPVVCAAKDAHAGQPADGGVTGEGGGMPPRGVGTAQSKCSSQRSTATLHVLVP